MVPGLGDCGCSGQELRIRSQQRAVKALGRKGGSHRLTDRCVGGRKGCWVWKTFGGSDMFPAEAGVSLRVAPAIAGATIATQLLEL